MTQFQVMAAFAVSGLLVASPVAAQGKSGTHGGAAATHGKPTSTVTTTHGKSGDTSHAKSGDATTHGKSADAHDKGDRHSGSQTTTTTTSTGSSALAAKIASNPDRLAKITPMLPTGMTLDQAAAGFRNQGQFIAALNASKNQGVPFADLQKAMTVDGLSLGQAVRKLKEPTPTTGATTSGTTTGTTTTDPTAKS